MTLRVEVSDSAWDNFKRTLDAADLAPDAFLSREVERILARPRLTESKKKQVVKS